MSHFNWNGYKKIYTYIIYMNYNKKKYFKYKKKYLNLKKNHIRKNNYI